MSDQPISLTDIRERTERMTAAGFPTAPEVLALVEAVDQAYARGIAIGSCPGCGTNERVSVNRHADDCTFARFTDHKETRLCDCGRADVMDDRGLCGYCIEELDERHRNAEPEAPDGCP